MSNTISVQITKDNSKQVLSDLLKGIEAGLEECGMYGESRAIENLSRAGREDTGALGNSIAHRVVMEDAKGTCYIGTDMEYAPYVEFGTGQYYPSGRKTPWVYQDRKGQWHTTIGMEAKPYLKPAVTEHLNVYPQMIADGINGSL